MSAKVDPVAIRSVQVLTPRLQELKAEWEKAEPQVYVDDTLLFTESWKETEGLPIDIRWAKALEKRLLECPLLLRDGELLAGSLTKFIRGNGTLCAMKPKEILKMCERGKFDRKTSDTDSTNITPEDLAALKADAEYWIEHGRERFRPAFRPRDGLRGPRRARDNGPRAFPELQRLWRRRRAGQREVHRPRA